VSVRTAFSAALCLVVVGLVAINLAGAARDGTVAATFDQRGSCEAVVRTIGPSAAAAGLRAGDVIDGRAMSPQGRLAMTEGLAGDRAALAVRRGETRQTISVPYEPRSPTPLETVFVGAGLIVYLVSGALVLWRGRDAAAFGLGVFLLCFAAGAFNFGRTGFLPVGPRVAANVAQFAATTLTIYGAFVLNEALSRAFLGALTLRILRVAVLVYCTLFFIVTGGTQLALPLSGCVLPGYGAFVLFYLAGAIGVIAILGTAIARSRFADHRVNWIFWTTVFCFVPYIVLRGASRLFGVDLLHDELARLAIEGIPFLLLPISYAYVILRYRVIDVSFVLNRALAYTVLTTLLLGGVILAESFAEKVALSRNASLLLELAVPLTLGLSFDFLQKRLESGIDFLLFRGKHRAEEALLAFARDCAFVEKADTLRRRSVEHICEQARATGVALYERTATGYRLARAAGPQAFPGDVDADDGAFVRLRATLAPVDLEAVASAIARTGIAFPLATGGSLDGALICTPRESGEPYAPDEREILQRVSQSVASALTATRARERSEFVAQVADGALDMDEATARARELRANG
jgi:hypothetical protein